MFHEVTKLGTLTIPSGTTPSDSLDFRGWRSAAAYLTIFGPDTLPEVVKVQVSIDGSTWTDLQSSGADITVPAASSVVIKSMGYQYLRLASTTNVGADRTFSINAESGI